jgi:hypothetical protein
MPLHHALIIDAGWRHRVNACAMQRTQRKLLDLANSMGISDQILRMAERRTKGDVMLVYGGMVCSCTQHSLAIFYFFESSSVAACTLQPCHQCSSNLLSAFTVVALNFFSRPTNALRVEADN